MTVFVGMFYKYFVKAIYVYHKTYNDYFATNIVALGFAFHLIEMLIFEVSWG